MLAIAFCDVEVTTGILLRDTSLIAILVDLDLGVQSKHSTFTFKSTRRY